MRLTTHCHMNYISLAQVTEPGKALYAARHGYEFRSYRNNELHMVSWERVDHWIDALPGSGWLFHTGCDAAITNPAITLESLIDPSYDLIICCDGNGPNADSWLMRECRVTSLFLGSLKRLRLEWRDFGMAHEIAHEQDGMTLLLSAMSDRRQFDAEMGGCRGFHPEQFQVLKLQEMLNRSPVRVKIVPQRVLNSYPVKYYRGQAHNEYAEWAWHVNDFLCHMPGQDLDVRVAAFKEILNV
jgi:hypothetical protein